MGEINLVVQTAFLGDLILSVPILQRIKKNNPHQQLAIVCKKGLGDFLLQEKLVDIVFEVEKSNQRSYKAIQYEIKNYKINFIFCIHRSLRSLNFVSGLKANKKIGFASWFGFWVFDETVNYIKEYPDVIRQFKILETTDEDVRSKLLDGNFDVYNQMQSAIPDFFS